MTIFTHRALERLFLREVVRLRHERDIAKAGITSKRQIPRRLQAAKPDAVSGTRLNPK
jgi:hypothetical protein